MQGIKLLIIHLKLYVSLIRIFDSVVQKIEDYLLGSDLIAYHQMRHLIVYIDNELQALILRPRPDHSEHIVNRFGHIVLVVYNFYLIGLKL